MKTKMSLVGATIGLLLLGSAPGARAESMATIDDPDGYTNVRGEENKIIGRVKTGEKFLTWQPHYQTQQWEVMLPSGLRGLMHRSRIRLLPGEPIMKLSFPNSKKQWKQTAARGGDDNSEIDELARQHGINYSKILARAADGDLDALRQFFSLSEHVDGAAAESHNSIMWELFHVVGDEQFARFLDTQSAAARKEIKTHLTSEGTTWPITNGRNYLKLHFPKTFALLNA